ncbi:MAG TPA: peptide ABC transporter substrate-binding protein [Methylomusa anaerophila]|uniref:Oligopeptide-binding protein OppA n=1 Tax=Methylomusa anaerophila TaxID=1930071 RepID=A0A348ANK8_9FIRM|nr:peptide ABC transporter substrate-binding protein [Methylomusa anaerophila]BBB92656.1 oligopeptide-binding protein OppA precursor [Methylomusa anaerophila]HML87491.1 peptide ABC transporter substrate-binding protein [Methylomusa anaerophila]
MSWKKLCLVMLVVLMFASLLAGCGRTTTGKPDAKYLRFCIGSEPETLDPRKSTGTPESTVESQIFEGLAALDSKEIPVPAAAERWEISPDGLKYKFYIRQNAKWSNGDPVTAHDFEYAWKETLRPEFASKYAIQLYYLKNGEAYNTGKATADQVGVKALDDKTLEVTLEAPTPYFLSLTTFHTYYPVNKKIVSANEKWASDVNTLIGNGPFKIANWTHNSKIELVKNENYWDIGKVKMEKLDLIITDNAATALSMFENGQVDFIDQPYPPAAEVPRLKQENKLQVFPYLGTYYYSFNNNAAPTDNPKVRKALSLAIDRDAIVKNITKTEEIAATAWIPPGLTDAKPGEDFRKVGGDFVKYDVETAKKLLAEAGYPDGKGFPVLTVIYNTDDRHKAIAEAIQEMWKKNLGINVTLSNQEWKVFINNRQTGNYQIARHGWIGDYPDPMTFLDLFIIGSGNNDPQYKNPEYDKLVKLAQSTNDQTIRMKAMHDAEKLLMDEAVLAPIYFYTFPAVVKPNVKGVIRSITHTTYLKEAYLE